MLDRKMCGAPGRCARSAAVLALLAVPAAAEAQVSPIPGTGYATRSEATSYSGCPGTVERLTEGSGGGVKQTYDVNLPFAFRFYGRTETTLTIFSGGAVAFPRGQSISVNNTALGQVGSPNGLIAPFWGDLELLTSNNGFLGTSVTGSAPNRQFCVEWNNFNDEQVNASRLNFKVVLHEGGAGRIDIHYGPVTGAPGSYTATMGMEDQAGARPIDFRTPACSPNCGNADLLALVGQRLTFVAPVRDLVAAEIVAPQFGFLGAGSSVDVVVASLDDATLGPVEVAVRAADNPEMTGASRIGQADLALSPFETLSTSVPVVFPSRFPAQSRIWLEVQVDAGDAVQEDDETNNAVVSTGSTLLLPGAPNLAVIDAQTAAQQLSAGERFEVTATFENRGSELARNAEAAVVLSTNPVITGGDTRLASTRFDLAPQARTTERFSVTLPATTQPGTYVLGVVADPDGQIAELDEADNGRVAASAVDVVGGGLELLTTALPAASAGEIYSATLRAAGGSGSYRFQIVSGALPAGLGLVADTGELFGRPRAAGTSTFTVGVEDEAGATASRALSLEVQPPPDTQEPLTVVTREIPAAVVGSPYRFSLQASGGQTDSADLSWSASEGLPSGLTLGTDGVLSGVTRETGSFAFEATVQGGGASASRRLTLDVLEASGLQIVTEPLPLAQLGRAYEHTLRAVGGISPVTWRVEQGDLESIGLSLSIDGRLSGTPMEGGTFRFEVVARDGGRPGQALEDAAQLVLEVEDDRALEITTEMLPVGRVGQGYDEAIAAAGGLAPYEWSIVQGELPPGLSSGRSPVTNELRVAGTPSEVGSATLLVEASDAEGRVTQRAFRLEILPAPAEAPPEDEGCRAAGGRSSAGLGMLVALAGWGLVRRRRPRVHAVAPRG
jgi:hypothetical protein